MFNAPLILTAIALILFTVCIFSVAYIFFRVKHGLGLPSCINSLPFCKNTFTKDSLLHSFYDENSIIHLRYNRKTGVLSSINQFGAEFLGFQSPAEAIGNKSVKDNFLTEDSLEQLYAEIRRNKKTKNFPITTEINGTTYKMIVTAKEHGNRDIEAFAVDITSHLDIYQEVKDQYLLLQNLLNALPAPVFVCDADHKFPFTNEAFTKIFNDISIGDTENGNQFLYDNSTDAPESVNSGDTVITKETEDGPAYYNVQKRILHDKVNDRYGMVGIATDLTEIKKAKQNLQETTRRYKNIFWNAAEGISTISHDGKITEANPAMAALCGYTSPEQLLEEAPNISSIWLDTEQFKEYLTEVSKNQHVNGHEIEFTKRDGSTGWMQVSSSGKFSNSGKLEYIESIARDITLKKQAEYELTRCATIDITTGIHNRNALENHLQSLIEDSQVTHFTVAFLDLNDFKPINDTHGHDIGDIVLQTVAKRLATCCRKSDFTARLGGDEFIVIYNGVADPEVISKLTANLQKTISEPIVINEIYHRISASIGVSRYPHDGTSTIELLKAADTAMYAVKRKNKGYTINDQLRLLASFANPQC